MKQTSLIILLGLVFMCEVWGQKSQQLQSGNADGETYINEVYRFSAVKSDDWILYGEIKNDTVYHEAVVAWGLPVIYSELEKTEIENSISITAYQRNDVTSIETLIAYEKERVAEHETVFEVDKTNPDARIIYTTMDGLKYKGKAYYIFKNGRGYVVLFMATPGTYDKNINTFEDFYTTVKVLKP